jgi:hypothetical protein
LGKEGQATETLTKSKVLPTGGDRFGGIKRYTMAGKSGSRGGCKTVGGEKPKSPFGDDSAWDYNVAHAHLIALKQEIAAFNAAADVYAVLAPVTVRIRDDIAGLKRIIAAPTKTEGDRS